MQNRTNLTIAIIVGVILLMLCCVCLVVALGFGMLIERAGVPSPDTDFEPLFSEPTATPVVVRPGELLSAPLVSTTTLTLLENTLVPVNDPRELAMRLEGKSGIPVTLPPPPVPLQVGAQETFWVSDVDTNENFQVSATLQYVTDHLYFWIQDEVEYDLDELEALAETFESQIYPINREFFGSEWTPGVDGDPHLYILYARGLGYSIAGYFSANDEYPPQVHEYSNAHEMFLLNADNVGLDEAFTYGVLAHEFQHMIHWYRDRNEATWLNEGFSDLAMFLNGYPVGGHDILYTADPDLQLNDWPNDPDQTTPHYGASFLFTAYFLDRFGEQATKALVTHPANGLVSIDAVLAEIDARDLRDGRKIGADEVFLDWVLASYLQDDTLDQGLYAYENYPSAPRPADTETITACPLATQTRDVHQYGVDYIRITCRGDFTLTFEGSTQVAVLPADPYSGEFAFWSNKGDESDMTLTRVFDFRDHDGPLTLSFRTWYDLEEDFDYLYLEASTDGERWEILTTPSGTAADPTGANYGWGYNGRSGGGPAWIEEQVDLSAYASQQVWIRFEYITDAAVNGEGFLLDDVSVPQVGYFSDFEDDEGGWEAQGFVRIQNVLPQTYRLALIAAGRTSRVTPLALGEDNRLEIPLQLGDEVDEVTLVVTGTARFTRQTAPYRINIQP